MILLLMMLMTEIVAPDCRRFGFTMLMIELCGSRIVDDPGADDADD